MGDSWPGWGWGGASRVSLTDPVEKTTKLVESPLLYSTSPAHPCLSPVGTLSPHALRGRVLGRAVEAAEELWEWVHGSQPCSEAGGRRPEASRGLDYLGDFGSSRPFSWLRNFEKWAKSGRQGLRRLGLLPWPPGSLSSGLVGLWLVPLGNIQVLACNQYLPGGLLSCSLRRDWAAGRLLGAMLICQGWEALPWLLSPPPGPHSCSLGLLGAPWCWIPTNLGLLEVSVPVCLVVFPPFLSDFQGLYHYQPFIHVSHPTPNPQPTQQLPEIEPRDRPHPASAAFPPLSPQSAGLWQCPWCSSPSMPLPAVAQLKTNDTHNTLSGQDGPHRPTVRT